MRIGIGIGIGAAALAGGLVAVSAAPAQPGDVPRTNNPFARPDSMGEKDRLFDRDEQIRRGIQAEADRRAAAAAKPAAAGEVKAGAAVADREGRALGTIESVEADGAVVVTAAGKAKVPLEAFGKNAKGLLLAVTKREFESLVAKANAAPAG